MSPEQRLPFGIPVLDRHLRGGLVPGTSTLVIGNFGSGKTMLGLQLITHTVTPARQGLYLLLDNDPKTMVVPRDGIGAGFRELVGKNQVLVKSYEEFRRQEGLGRLKNICLVRKIGMAIIDGLHFMNSGQYQELPALLETLIGQGVTVLLNYGFPYKLKELDAPAEKLAFSCDTVIGLAMTDARAGLDRQLTIIKMRGSSFTPAPLDFSITRQGMVIKRAVAGGPAARRGKEKVLLFRTFSFFHEKWIAYYRLAGAQLAKKFPGISFAEINEKQLSLRQMLSAKESNVAITLVPADEVTEFARRGLLLPLNDVLPRRTQDQFLDRALAGCRWQGNLYAIPRFIDRNAVFYNKRLLEKYGLAPPANWDEMLTQMETIMDREKDPELVGFMAPGFRYSGQPFLFIEYLWHRGQDIFSPHGADAGTGAAALAFMEKVIGSYHRLFPLKGFPRQAMDKTNHFFSGQGIFLYTSMDTYFYPSIFKLPKSIDYGVALMPRPVNSGHPAFILHGTSMAIPANTRFPDLAKKVLRFFADYRNNRGLHAQTDFAIGLNTYKRFYDRLPAHLKPLDLTKVLDNGRFFTELEPYYYDVFPFIDRELLLFMTGKRDPARVVRRINEHCAQYAQRKKYSVPVNKVISFIEANYHASLTLANIAATINIGPNHLNRLFKLAQGVPCMEYVIRLRMQRARDLLNNADYRVNEIARLVGYDNPYYFSRLFKKKTGVSPEAFRRAVI
jgi:ABC-type glycerol-3-phosphate transport system substrate-binding protein/AraC-like DNA-binding protein